MRPHSNRSFALKSALFLLSLGALGVSACDCGGNPIAPCASANPPASCGLACTDGGSECGAGTYCGPDGTCTADCVVGDGNCGSGQVCDPTDGRCIDDPGTGGGTGGGTGTGGGSGGGGGDGGTCTDFTLTAEPVKPYVIFIVDRSGSMDAEYPPDSGTNCSAGGVNCPSRWDSVRNVLLGDGAGPLAEGIIEQFQAFTYMGVVQYTGHQTSGNVTSPFPDLIETPAALNNRAAILADYEPFEQDVNPPEFGETPTGEAIWMTLCHLDAPYVDRVNPTTTTRGLGCDAFEANVDPDAAPAEWTPDPAAPLLPPDRDPNAPVIFFLATDGEPDSSVNPNPTQDSIDGRIARHFVLDAVEDALEANIKTYVISVVTGDNLNLHLDHVACQGGTGPAPATAPYGNNDPPGDDGMNDPGEPVCTNANPDDDGPGGIEAYNVDDLRTQFQTLIGQNIPCVFTLTGSNRIAPESVEAAREQGAVTIDGVTVPLADGPSSGSGWWIDDDGQTFRLVGEACEDFQEAPGAELEASFPCGGDIIIIPI